MAKKTISILLFTTEEDIEQTRRARALRAGLEKAGWQARVVNRLSNNLDELLLAAEHRVVHLPRWLVIDQGEVCHDANTMPSFNEAQRVLAKFERRR